MLEKIKFESTKLIVLLSVFVVQGGEKRYRFEISFFHE